MKVSSNWCRLPFISIYINLSMLCSKVFIIDKVKKKYIIHPFFVIWGFWKICRNFRTSTKESQNLYSNQIGQGGALKVSKPDQT